MWQGLKSPAKYKSFKFIIILQKMVDKSEFSFQHSLSLDNQADANQVQPSSTSEIKKPVLMLKRRDKEMEKREEQM